MKRVAYLPTLLDTRTRGLRLLLLLAPHRWPTDEPQRREAPRGIRLGPPTRSPTRRTTPRSPTKGQNAPDRLPDERAPLRGAGRKASAGGARRAAHQSSHRTFSFPPNFPVLLELSGSSETSGFHQNRKVLSERKRSPGTQKFSWHPAVLWELAAWHCFFFNKSSSFTLDLTIAGIREGKRRLYKRTKKFILFQNLGPETCSCICINSS